MIEINPERLLSDLRALARIGQYKTGVDRVAFSAADIEARQWLATRFRDAGLDTSMDRFGTIYGASPRAPRAILIGSHSDTVPRGGWLDGALGIIYGLEIARAALEDTSDASCIGIDVINFQDEEGTYLPFLGSLSFVGELTNEMLAAAKSTDGRKLTDAMASADLVGDPHHFDAARQIAFLEAHIEQGPRLESSGNQIGIVTGIVGIRRFRIVSQGRADHAGTTPMHMRRDALMPLFEIGQFVAQYFPKHAGTDTVWNIGRIEALPGAANVVPAQASLILEFRDTSRATLDALEMRVASEIGRLNTAGAELSMEKTADIAPTVMDAGIVAIAGKAADQLGIRSGLMQSGAGHDTMIMARRMPSGMIFVPSIDGRSHDIAENTKDQDIVAGCRVMARIVDLFRHSNSA